MFRKPIRIFIRSTVILVALVAIAAGAAAWRLYLGPIDAEFAARRIQRELSRSFPNLSIGFGKTQAFWPEDMAGLPLHSKNLQVFGEYGSEIARFPEVVVTVAPLALLQGQVRLQSIRIVQPEIALERDADGGMTLQAGAAPSPGRKRFFALLLDRLSGPPNDAGPFGALRSIEIVGADVTLTDSVSRQVWRADRLQSTLSRGPDGIVGNLSFTLQVGRTVARLAGAGLYRPATGAIGGTLKFNGLAPEVLAKVWKPLSPLANLRMTLSGKAEFAGSDTGRIDGASLDIEGGAGSVRLPGVYREPVRLKALRATVVLKDGGRTAEIGGFRADLGETALTAKGTLRKGNGKATIEGSVSFSGFGVAALRRLWPAGIGRRAKRWFGKNIDRGRVSRLDTDFRLSFDKERKPAAKLDRLDGRFGFKDLTIRLPGSLPPLRQVGGDARFDLRHFDFRFDRGKLGRNRVSAGTARIDGLGGKVEKIAIAGTIDGGLNEILHLAGRKALAQTRKLGADPAAIRGKARVRLKTSFPLIDRLSFRNVAIAANAEIREASWPKALFGLDLAKGRFRLDVDKAGFKLDGESLLAGTAAKLVWHEKFGRLTKSWRRRLSVKGTTTPKALRAAGLDLRQFISGPFRVDATVSAFDNGRTSIDGAYDFRGARLTVPVLNVEKPPGMPARGSSRLTLSNGRLTAISRFALQSTPVSFRGKASFEKNGRTLRRLTVDRLTAGRTRLRATVERSSEAGRRVRLTGPILDLSPLFARRTAGSKRADPGRSAGNPALGPINVSLKVNRLFVARKVPLRSATGSARYDGKELRRLQMAAALSAGKSLSLRLAPVGGRQTITLISDDGGAALRALGIVDSLRGGSLSVRAVRRPTVKDNPMSGTLRLKNFRIVRAPAIARFFSAVERRRIDKSVLMQRLEMHFDLQGDRFEIREGRAYSSLIGVTASGRIDRAKRIVQLRGTLVPLYALNSVFGKVPIIGDLLVGEKGSGLLAAHFTVRGSLDKPKYSVNPISLLAPGAIRRIFDFGSGSKSGKDKRN